MHEPMGEEERMDYEVLGGITESGIILDTDKGILAGVQS